METNAGMSRGKKLAIGVILVLTLLTAAAYGFGVYYFTHHFLPGSSINGFRCAYMTEKEAERVVAAQAAAYALAVETRNNGVEAVTAADVGLTYTPDGSVGRLMCSQNRFRWFLSFQQKQDYLIEAITYDETALRHTVKSLACMQQENLVEPVNAHLEETEEGYVIAPEKEGAYPEAEKVVQAVGEALKTGKATVNLEAAGCYRKPSVYRDDERLQKDCEQANSLTKAYITYDFADRTETVDRSVIKNWLTRDQSGDLILDKQKVALYVNALGRKYDTFGKSHSFSTYDGREITVDAGGDYGWAIDQKAETESLMQAVLSGVTEVREPQYLYSGWSRAENDIGYTYVEIDLTNQRMVFYKDGTPVADTYVVTGNPNVPGWETPTGCFAVDAMKSPAVLTGEDYQSDVTFWIPFAGNVGIHDASWRTEFGGTLYMWEGSHGCVNAPYDKAEIIYRNMEIGMPVVVYK